MKVKRAKITINLTCCHCMFYKRMKAPQFDDRCANLGTQGNDLPCEKFAQNYHMLNLEEDGYSEIARALRTIEGNKLIMLAALINKEHNTRAFGYKFGQPLIVKLKAANYLDSYVKVNVIAVDKDYIYVSGKDKLKGLLLHDSVITLKEFAPIRDRLRKAKRIHSPKSKEVTRKLPRLANEEELAKMREAVDNMFTNTPVDIEKTVPKRTRKKIVRDGMTTVEV